jgi:hypothetical protein
MQFVWSKNEISHCLEMEWYGCKWQLSYAKHLYNQTIFITVTILGIIHHPVLSKTRRFGDTDSVSVFKWNLLCWAQERGLVCLHTLAITQIGFIKPTKHKPPLTFYTTWITTHVGSNFYMCTCTNSWIILLKTKYCQIIININFPYRVPALKYNSHYSLRLLEL